MLFDQCIQLKEINFNNFNGNHKLMNISGMFKNCSRLRKLDLSSWNFNSVNAVDEFFLGCTKLEEVLSPTNLKNNNSNISLKDSSQIREWYLEDGTEERQVDYFEKVDISKRYFSKEKEDVILKVNFSINGELSSNKKFVTYEQPYGELPIPTPAVNGLVFKYWTTESGSPVYEDTIVDTPNDHTLYAKWMEVTVSYDANGGYGQQYLDGESKQVTYGEAYGKLASGPSAPKGMQFDGWYTEKVGGGKVTENTLVGTVTDHTLYAHWKIKKPLNENYIIVTEDMGGINYYPYYTEQYIQIFTDDTSDDDSKGNRIYGYDHVYGKDPDVIDDATAEEWFTRAMAQAIVCSGMVSGTNLLRFLVNIYDRDKLYFPGTNDCVDCIVSDAYELFRLFGMTQSVFESDYESIFDAAFEVLEEGDSIIIASAPNKPKSFSYQDEIVTNLDLWAGINCAYDCQLLAISFDGEKYDVRYKWYISDY